MSKHKKGTPMKVAVTLARLAIAASSAAAVLLAGNGAAQAVAHPASIVVSGIVSASDGRAGLGATVVIHAWPDQAVIQGLKIGQKVPWVVVGTGTADATGRYSISIPVSELAPEESDGVVNLEADAPSAVAFFPVAVTKNTGDAYLPSAPKTVDLKAASGFPGCGGPAGWQYVKNLGRHWATVGETYVRTTGATQQFTYSRGQSSSIGIGLSTSGHAGSFTPGGTMAWSASHGKDWPVFGANRSVWYRTTFNFGEYSCSIPTGARTSYVDIVNGFGGGFEVKTPTSIPNTPAKFCITMRAGSLFQSGNSPAVTWTGSLGIATGLGFQASIQTGFDRGARITYRFTANRHLCGQKSDPGGAPGQLVVHT